MLNMKIFAFVFNKSKIFLMSVSFFLVCAFMLSGCSPSKERSVQLWKEGRVALTQGRQSDAMILFQNAVDADESNVNAHVSIQKQMLASGRNDECLRRYKDLFQKKPSDAWRRYLYARLLPDPQAGELYEIGLSSSPKYAYFYYALAVIELNKNNLPAAEKLFDRALILDPSITDAYIQMGRLYSQKKDLRLSRKCFMLSAEQDPVQVEPYLYLGNIELVYGHITEALDYYDKAAKIDPGDERVRYAIAKIDFLKGRYDKSLSVFRELMEKDPRNSRYLCSAARALFMLGERSEALKCLDQALTLICDQAEIHSLKFLLYIRNGDVDKAEAEFYLAEKTSPLNMDIRKIHALFYLINGRQQDAFKLFDAFQKSPELESVKGIYYRLNGEPAKAEASFYTALGGKMDSYPDIAGLGWALEASGKEDKAIELYNRALEKYPKDGLFSFCKAGLLADKGDMSSALVFFTQSLEDGYLDERGMDKYASLKQLLVQPRVASLIELSKNKGVLFRNFSSYDDLMEWYIISAYLRI